MNKILFVGLGKLGLPLACVLASGKDNRVLCLDKNEHVLEKLRNDELPFYEHGLEELWSEVRDNIVGYIDSYSQGVADTNIAVVLVNTQLGDDGYSSDFVESAVSDIAVSLRSLHKEYYTIALSSTVLPGTIVGKLIPLMEKLSGLEHGKHFGFSYIPDFVKLGSVIQDFKNPEFFLIGFDNTSSLAATRKIFEGVHDNNPPLEYLTLEEAEIAKVALNAYLVSKISFANFLGLACEGLENVNVHSITDVIGKDKRISPHFFRSGPPYGGTCFPRDVWAFNRFAQDQGLEAKHIAFAEKINNMMYERLFMQCIGLNEVGILGMSFKTGSSVTTGSPSIKLLNELSELGITVNCYDKSREVLDALPSTALTYATAQQCVNISDTIIIMHNDWDFAEVEFLQTNIIDPWGLVE